MNLYLIRHGEAVPEKDDPARPLSEKGRAQVKDIAQFLKEGEINLGEIWVSDKLRAGETAEMLANDGRANKILQKTGLSPNDPIIEILEDIYAADKDIAIVGHLPFLSKLLSQILTSDEFCDIAKFEEAGMVCLERGELGWQIEWVVSPKII